MSAYNVTETASLERAITLTDLMVMDKELAQAIHDLELTWAQFQYGSMPPEDTSTQPTAAHRIDGLHYDLVEYVQRLRSVTSSIAGRI